jgi:hypothetical protein
VGALRLAVLALLENEKTGRQAQPFMRSETRYVPTVSLSIYAGDTPRAAIRPCFCIESLCSIQNQSPSIFEILCKIHKLVITSDAAWLHRWEKRASSSFFLSSSVVLRENLSMGVLDHLRI